MMAARLGLACVLFAASAAAVGAEARAAEREARLAAEAVLSAAAVWLAPESLPSSSEPLSAWPDAIPGGPGAIVDNSQCYPGLQASCAFPPTVSNDASGRASSVRFSAPGRLGLGSNLIIPLNLSASDAGSTILFAYASSGSDVLGQRLLAASTSNFLLGTWYDSQAALRTKTARTRAPQMATKAG